MRFQNLDVLMNQAGGEGGSGGAGSGGAGASGGQGASGGTAGAAGNSGGTGDKQGGNGGGDKGGVISRAEFERVMQDMHKFKDEARTLKEQIESEKTSKLKEQNDWKQLAERYENENKTLKETNTRIQDSFLGERKFNAVRDACAKLGLRPEAASDLEMLDLNAITVETTSTGRINVLGAETFADRLKTLKPHWFSDKTPPSVNTNGTRVIDTGGQVTARMIVDAEREGRKSGDMSKYNQMVRQFQQQRAASSRR